MIYVHYNENVFKFKELISTYLNFVFFNDFNEIKNNFVNKTEKKNYICCVEDLVILKKVKKYPKVWIINFSVLRSIVEDYGHFFSNKSPPELLNDVDFQLFGFPNDETLMTLGCKAVMLGATINNSFNELTHLISHRLTGNIVVQHLRRCNKIYNKIIIEYYWSNCMTILTPYIYSENEILEEQFQARLFMNCRIILIGFKNEDFKNISRNILRKGGSIINIRNVDLASHLVYPKEWNSDKSVHAEFNTIPVNMQHKIVCCDWLKISLESGFLASVENYIYFSIDETEDEKSTAVIQQIYEPKFHIQKSVSGYDPRTKSEEKIAEFRSKRAKEIKELFKVFEEKYEFYNEFNTLMLTLISEHEELSNITMPYISVEEFYKSIYNSIESLVDDVDYDTFFGILVHDLFLQLKPSHLKYINDSEKFLNVLKVAMKQNVILRKVFDDYLYKIRLSLEMFVSRPVPYILKMQMIVLNIMSYTPYSHPDLPYIENIYSTMVDFTNYTNFLFTQEVEFKKQTLISKYMNSTICSNTSTFVCVVDCALIENDSKIPMSMFIFSDRIILCNFKDVYQAKKRLDSICKFLSGNSKNSKDCPERSTLLSYSSTLSLNESPCLNYQSSNICKRNESTTSSVLNGSMSLLSNKSTYAKYSKLFTGLSHVALLSPQPSATYTDICIIDRSRIVSIESSSSNDDVFMNLVLSEDDTKKLSHYHFWLVPRVVKMFSEYRDIGKLFEDDFQSEIKDIGSMSFEKFIATEKHNFCEFLATLYKVEFIDNNVQFENKDRDLFSNDQSSYKTPVKICHIKDRPSSSAKFITKSFVNYVRKSFATTPKEIKNIFKSKLSQSETNQPRACSSNKKEFQSPKAAYEKKPLKTDNDETDKENEIPSKKSSTEDESKIRAKKRKSYDIKKIENKSARF